MAGITDLERNIARLEQATADARAATRDAHAARKDLDTVLREARELLAKDIHEAVDASIADTVKEGLDGLREAIRKASSDCYDRVMAQVDVLLNMTLGKPGMVGKGREDLRPALAAKLREWINDELAKVI